MTGTNSIIGGGEDGNNSSSTPFYWPIGGTYNNFTTEAQAETQINAACTLQNMCLNGTTGSGTGATVVLDHNGSTGYQTVTWANQVSTPTIMEDTTHTDSISAGDTVDYKRSALNSSFSMYASSITMNASSPAVEYVLSMSATTTFATSVYYMPIAGDWPGLQNDNTENSWLWTHWSEAGTFSHAQMNVASASSGTITAQVRKNGSNANQVVTVASGTGITVDSTHTDSVILGDYMTWAVSSTNASGYAQVFALLFEGTNSAHTLMGGYGTTSNFGDPNYFPMMGRTTSDNSTETYTQMNATYAFTSSYFRMNSGGWAGRSSTTTCTFRNNTANGNQILYTNANFVVDVTHTDSVVSGDPYDCVQTATGNLSQMQMSVDDGSYDGHGTAAYFPPWVDVGANTAANITVHMSQSNVTNFSQSSTFGTSGPEELVIAFISYNTISAEQGANPSVSSLTVSGLTFTKLNRWQNSNTPLSGFDPTIEIWTAPATSQFNSAGSSLTWAITFSAEVDNAVLIPMGVAGLQSLSSPYDPDGSLPGNAVTASSTTPPTITYSTTDAYDLLLMATTSSAGGHLGTGPTGWTTVDSKNNGSGTQWSTLIVSALQVRATQSSATVADSSTSSTYWNSVLIGLTGNVGSVTFDESITETLSASDAVSETAVFVAAVAEAVSAMDAVSANGLIAASITETLTAADSVSETLITPNCAVVVIIMH